MRVVFLLSSLARGGAQRQAVLTGLGLQERGHEVSFVVFRSRSALDTELEARAVPIAHLGHDGRWGGLFGRLRLLCNGQVAAADIVYAYMPAANVTATLAASVRRWPAVVWGVRDSGLDLGAYGAGTRLLVWLERRLARRPRLIICNSHSANRHYVDRGFPENRTVTVPNGIDTDRFCPDALDRRATRDALGVRGSDMVILCLARADPMKGHSDLLGAFAQALPRVPSATLLLVGDHDVAFAGWVKYEAERLGVEHRVSLLTGTARPESYLRAADLLVVPSIYGEGFPNVIGEAMACGLPVVTTDVGDAGLVVGDLGVVVQPSNPVELADAIVSVLTGAVDLGLASDRRRRVAECFSVDRMVDSTESYLAVASARRPG